MSPFGNVSQFLDVESPFGLSLLSLSTHMSSSPLSVTPTDGYDRKWAMWEQRRTFLFQGVGSWDGEDGVTAGVCRGLLYELPDPELNMVDDGGRTLLMNAAGGHAESIVYMLCERGADTTSVDEWGATALHLSAATASDASVSIMQAVYEAGVAAKTADKEARALEARKAGVPTEDDLDWERFKPVEGEWPPTDSYTQVGD